MSARMPGRQKERQLRRMFVIENYLTNTGMQYSRRRLRCLLKHRGLNGRRTERRHLYRCVETDVATTCCDGSSGKYTSATHVTASTHLLIAAAGRVFCPILQITGKNNLSLCGQTKT